MIFQYSCDIMVLIKLQETIIMLENFEPYIFIQGKLSLNITDKYIKFGKNCRIKLNKPEYIKIYFDAKNKQMAIQPALKEEENSLKFDSNYNDGGVRIAKKQLVEYAYYIMGKSPDKNVNYSVNGEYYTADDIIVFDFKNAVERNKKK